MIDKKKSKRNLIQHRPEQNFAYLKNSNPIETSASLAMTSALQCLSDILNQELIIPFLSDRHGNKLGAIPDHIISVEALPMPYKGYAVNEAWVSNTGDLADQVTLVFPCHRQSDLKDVAATLVHEQIHVKQNREGKPSVKTPAYHNREFADWLRSTGIQTSTTGEPDGAPVGVKMGQYVVEGGPFDQIMNCLIAQGFSLPWDSTWKLANYAPNAEGGKHKEAARRKAPKRKDRSKTKFTCPNCGQIARANHDAELGCRRSGCQDQPMLDPEALADATIHQGVR